MTSSTVVLPTIVQTLPVHITLTATSTKGFDGYFTLADLVQGASSVVKQPIATATFDLDATGLLPSNLDLSNVDLSQYDLSSLTSVFGGSDQGQMVDALTALLQQYGAEPPRQVSSKVSTSTRRKSGTNQNIRVQNDRNSDFEDDFFIDHEEPPKFNVIKGFTLSDRAPASSGPTSGGGGGSAATATRYSKYHKKPDPANNGLAAQKTESDRESERYSASTSRRTFSNTSGGKLLGRKSPSSRFQPAQETQYFEEGANDRLNNGKRNNRNIESGNISSRRKGELDDRIETSNDNNNDKNIANRISSLKRFTSRGRPNNSQEKIIPVQPDKTLQTTVLTMFVSGTAPGDFKKTLRTVTLKSFQTTPRSKRHALLATKIPETASSTHVLSNFEEHVNNEKVRTVFPDEVLQSTYYKTEKKVRPEEVVRLLKSLDKNSVKSMLKSLSKWVKYYTNELMDDENIENETSVQSKKQSAPILASSLSMATETAFVPTTQISEHTGRNDHSSCVFSKSFTSIVPCLAQITVTETLYHTVLLVP